MTVQEKIAKMRELYIAKHGKEPTTLLVGRQSRKEMKSGIKEEFPYWGSDVVYRFHGMRVITDNDKPSRVEVGDFEV